MKDSFELGLDLVSDIAKNPGVRAGGDRAAAQADAVDAAGQLRRSRLLAGVVFDRLVYGFHPYGRPDSGTPASIAGITRDDLVAVPPGLVRRQQRDPRHRRRRDRRRSVRRRPSARSATWRKATTARPARPRSRRRPTRRLVVIDKPGAVQTEIRVGHTGAAAEASRLSWRSIWRSRSSAAKAATGCTACCDRERGLTYGASADTERLKQAGDDRRRNRHAIGDDRRSAAPDRRRVLAAAARARRRTRTGGCAGLPDRQLSADHRDAERHRGRRCSTRCSTGSTLEDLQTFRERVNAVTSDDIQRVAQTYLQSRPAVDRPGRRRDDVREAAAGARIRTTSRRFRSDSSTSCRPR